MTDSISVNKTHFNKIAAEYDSKFETTIGILEQHIRDNLDWVGVKEGGRLLDYACGTGILSRTMGPRLKQCVGIDLSESMVEQYNGKAQSQGFSPETRQAHTGNILIASDPSPPAFSGPSFHDFDIAGVGLGFHHLDDCDLAARRLGERLRPGGVLFILDFLPHERDPDHSAETHGVLHAGFSEETVRAVYEGAGVGGGFAFKDLGEISFQSPHGGKDMRRRVFISRGEKV